ncbi:hypothetical protein ONZ45_g5190 [Pleurotus djamor]|nr:hypothetical protein ONZ45_g5190 [Pleurotus djamor]
METSSMGWEWNLALAPYGEGWRARRRVFWQEFNLSSLRCSPYKPIQLKHARRFLRRLFESPDKFIEHTHYAPASTILEATYGLDIALYDDKLIDLISTTVHHFEKIMGFGTVWVDAFPWLQHLPKWFPGAGFRRVADAAHKDTMKMIEIPYAEAVQQYNAEQTSAPQSSVVSRSLLRLNAGSDRLTSTPEQDKLVKDVAAMAYIGGADTTQAPLLTLFAAMALYPDIQRKAQEEIDAVIMHDEHRLPAFDDIPHLVYCQAMVWELLRWQPFIPMAPLRGYANRSIMHDPVLFPEPERFMPERFIRKLDHGVQCELNKDLINIVTMSFGFGRRMCPGRAFALDSLQITLVSILFAFDISPAKDAFGKDILPELELEPLLVS